jgi:FkbM family methyltransferase
MFLSPPSRNAIQAYHEIGHNRFLYSYLGLNKESHVLIFGGYKGGNTQIINSQYGCKITVFEPVGSFFDELETQFSNAKNITCENYAITLDGRDLLLEIDKDSTHYAEEASSPSSIIERVKSLSIKHVLGRIFEPIDLMIINVEGMEYEIVEGMIQYGDNLPKSILLQTHKVNSKNNLDLKRLREKLSSRYTNIYTIHHVWERWELNETLQSRNHLIEKVQRHLKLQEFRSEEPYIFRKKPTSSDTSPYGSIKPSTSFLILATGEYFSYALDLILSMEKVGFEDEIEVLILTDATEGFYKSTKFSIKYLFVDPEPWPEITLLRFRKLVQFSHWIEGDYLVWVDADMKCIRKFDVEELLNDEEIRLSRHPGFSINWRESLRVISRGGLKSILNRITTILKQRTNTSGWECRIEMGAYVPWSRRKTYVQGGFWIGETLEAISMANEINLRILSDVMVGQMPAYHDETYLNWYFANSGCALLPKDFVGVEGYSWQDINASHLLCVDKGPISR